MASDDLQNAIIDIAADGDVILVVGTSATRLKVLSPFLRLASPVFRSMLKLGFKEGQQLRDFGSATIPLREDDAHALEIVLNVIHGCNRKVPDALSPGDLLQVAIIIDKYQCSEPLALAVRIWFSSTDFTHTTDTWLVALAALILGRERNFASATSSLIFHRAGSFTDLVKHHGTFVDVMMLHEIAARLEEKRNQLRLALIRRVLEGDWHCSSNKKGRHRPDRLSEFMRRAGNFEDLALSTILEALTKGGPRPEQPGHEEHEEPLAPVDESWLGPGLNSHSEAFQNISRSFRLQVDAEGGLCLSCITATGGEHQCQGSGNGC